MTEEEARKIKAGDTVVVTRDGQPCAVTVWRVEGRGVNAPFFWFRETRHAASWYDCQLPAEAEKETIYAN